MTSQPDPGPAQPEGVAGRLRAARRIRRWVGKGAFDELFGSHGPAEAAAAILRNNPAVTPRCDQDGRDLLDDRLHDHPRGLPVERWGLRLARLRNFGFVVGGVGLFGLLIAGLVLTLDAPATDPFEALAERLPSGMGPVAALLIGVPLAVGILLLWVLSVWRYVIILGEVRYAVRWSVGRTGQVTRGLPVADPFVGLGGALMACAVIVWIIAACAILFAVFLLSTGDPWPPIWLIALGLVLLGWGALGGRRALRQMGAVAERHLLLFGHREGGLRLDAATAVQEGFLLVTRDPSFFGTPSWSASQEWVVHPLTKDLSAAEVGRRHDQLMQDDGNLQMVGDRTMTPLVTLEVPRSGQDNDPGHRLDTASYAGGWLVARLRWNRRPAMIIVSDRPERFRSEILPAFGDRHGLDPDAIEWLTPQQVPDSENWLQDWKPSIS